MSDSESLTLHAASWPAADALTTDPATKRAAPLSPRKAKQAARKVDQVDLYARAFTAAILLPKTPVKLRDKVRRLDSVRSIEADCLRARPHPIGHCSCKSINRTLRRTTPPIFILCAGIPD